MAILSVSFIMSSEISAVSGVVNRSHLSLPTTWGTMPQWSRWEWVRNM